MAQHRLVISQPRSEILSSDVMIEVFENKQKIGALHISRGNIEWWPRYNKKNHFRLSWSKFATLFEELGKEVKN